jgi:hypothetical protein
MGMLPPTFFSATACAAHACNDHLFFMPAQGNPLSPITFIKRKHSMGKVSKKRDKTVKCCDATPSICKQNLHQIPFAIFYFILFTQQF